MEPEPTMSFDEAVLGRYVWPLCFCGNEIAPTLARLGSVHCHDCRDDSERARRHEMRLAASTVDRTDRGEVLAALYRLVSRVTRGLYEPATSR